MASLVDQIRRGEYRPPVHTDARPTPPKGGSLVDRIRSGEYERGLSRTALAARQATRTAQTNFPAGSPQARQAPAFQDGQLASMGGPPGPVIDTTTPQPDSSAVLDKPARQQLGRDLALGARVGLEVAGGIGGARAGREAGRRLFTSPFMRRLTESAVSGLGEGLGSLAASGTVDPVDRPFDEARRAALWGGFADAAGASLMGGWNKLFRGERRLRLEPGVRSSLRFYGDDVPTPGRLAENRTIDLAENFMDSSLATAGRAKMRNERAVLRIRGLLEDYVKRFTQGASRVDIDRLVEDVTTDRLDAFKETAESIYGRVDEIAEAGVDTGELIALRNDIVQEYQEGGAGQGIRNIVESIDRTLRVPKPMRGIDANVMISAERVPVQTARASVPFRAAQKLRSDMLGVTRDTTDTFAGQTPGNAKRVSKTVDRAMQAAGAALENPEAFELWRMGNTFWADGADAFGESVMQALANTRPDRLFETIMQEDSPEQIRRFRKLVLGGTGTADDTGRTIRRSAERTLRDPAASPLAKELAQRRIAMAEEGEKAWQKFQGQFFVNILSKSDRASGLATRAGRGGRTIVASSALDRLRAYGDDTLREMFPQQSKRRLFERFLRAMEIPQEGTGLTVATVAPQLAQAGAVFQLATSPLSPASAGSGLILLSPLAIARAFDDPDFIRWAVRGVEARPGSNVALRSFARMAELAARHGGRVIDNQGNVVADGREEPTREIQDLRDFQGTIRQRTPGPADPPARQR